MKTIIFFLTFILSTQAYYIDNGQLYNDQDQYMHVSGVKAVNLDFYNTSYGFILLTDGTLYMAKEDKTNGFKMSSKAVSYGTSEIEFPYIIENNDLYKFDEKTRSFQLIGYSLTDLCMRTVSENTNVPDEYKNYFAIRGNKLVPIRKEQRPTYCQ